MPILCCVAKAQEHGSAEARDRVFQSQVHMAEEQASLASRTKNGEKLFGVYTRLEKTDKRVGTLCSKTPAQFQIGDSGFIDIGLKALSRVSNTEYLVICIYLHEERILLLRGFDMSKVADDVEFILQQPVIMRTTFTYDTASGNQNTVLVAESNVKALDDVLAKEQEKAATKKSIAKLNRMAYEKRRRADSEERRRENTKTWTDSSGEHTMKAQFIYCVADKVKLKKEDGSVVFIPMEQLSEEDQAWVRNRPKTPQRSRTSEEKSVDEASTETQPTVGEPNRQQSGLVSNRLPAPQDQADSTKQTSEAIEVVSAPFGSKQQTKIVINKEVVRPDSGTVGRGLYVVALVKGKVVLNHVYDCLGYLVAANQFAEAIGKLPDGATVILVVNDDATQNFNQNAQQAILSIGGRIGLLGKPLRSTYYCIGKKGIKEGLAVEAIGQHDLCYPHKVE
jgi:hypothetical protein